MTLELFATKLQHYCRLTANSRKTLAHELGLHPSLLSHKLKGSDNRTLTHAEVKAIVKILAKWEAISSQDEALELLALVNCPPFTTQEWRTPPLNQLEGSRHLQSAVKFNEPSKVDNTSPMQGVAAPSAGDYSSSGRGMREHNLPGQLSIFIGREKEKQEVKGALTTSRLITLTGTGGVGKTRLALEVAGEIVDHFEEGVWLVELAPLTDSALVAQTIATALSLTEQSGRPLLATLSDYLRSRYLLLVLDNCEHLVEECARVVDALIRTSRDLHILATSREGLGITGEKNYRVPSLSVPEPDSLLDLKTLFNYEAVELFMERAVAVNPAFSLTHQTMEALVQVCRHLDGIPLAIELAAARLKVLPVGQLASRLDDRFRLLTGGSRTALPRHQTLKALVDWSYELLTKPEQELLARLSIFAGGWSLKAAEEVCRESRENGKGPGLEGFEVLNALSGLVNKSLVQLEEDNGVVRYYFLETIRQYGSEKLKAEGEEQKFQERHLAYYARLSTEFAQNVNNQGQLETLKLYDLELDNIRAAIDYGLKTEQVEAVLKTCQLFYWDVRGYYSELRRYLEQLLAIPATTGLQRGRVLYGLCIVAGRQGDGEAGHHYAEECLRVSTEFDDDKQLRLLAYHSMAKKQAELGKLYSSPIYIAEAKNYFEQLITLHEEIGDLAGKGSMQLELGMLLVEQGEYTRAHQLFVQILPLARKIGNLSVLTMTLGAQGRLALAQEDNMAAHRYLGEMRNASEEIGFRIAQIDALCYRGMAWSNEGNFEEARRSLDESLIMCMKGSSKNITANSLVGVARLLSQVWLKNGVVSQVEKVASLCGAIWALQGTPTSEEPLLIQPLRKYYFEAQEIASTSLSNPAFKEAFSRGFAMSLEEAINYARQALVGI